MSFWSEFKSFAVRGNVIDLAVGVVVGGAFGKIVTSLVNDIVTPPLGILIGGVDFANLKFTLRHAVGTQPAVTINYGSFIQTMINFVIIAFAIFVVIRMLNKLKRKEAEAPSLPPAPSREEVLLTEIRDALRERNASDSPGSER
ncbi:large-conductance mechanosensitive channel protein MscL [Salinisphaera hydrothermalis]|uniref:Large-conductance mechanosensitive channel n=1 Tax=Salinisphaera hydrothermalis (strain C41B8) TaxID=1304275 RepID=A0A084IM61_SALHC|nr:large-conductance mechanosensitive channel protein MscL [Salinisphaera hydrothermalis]KEZ77795.1 large-conductance mechanosensitive channel [Salinisphaera hydrothermalis C41B8]